MAPAASLSNLIKYAQANQGRLHAEVVARIQGVPDQAFLLTHPQGLDSPDDLQHALQAAADALGDPDARVDVPPYVQVLADRVEVIRARLSRRTLGMTDGAVEDMEREADDLGTALGAALARVYLEQRRERD